jgi:Predicted transmembrane transcriptional regulator (anti-sigma factor)
MQHPDEGTIHTWLDGELSAEDAAELEAHVADCAQCAAAVAEARGLIAGSSRIVSSLDSVPAGVIPERRPGSRAWYSTTQFRAAAALLLVAGTSLLLVRRNETSASRMMAVSAPRAKATDAASSPVAAAASAPAETAGTIPAVKPPPVVKAPSSSNAPVSGSAAVAAKAAPTAKRKPRGSCSAKPRCHIRNGWSFAPISAQVGAAAASGAGFRNGRGNCRRGCRGWSDSPSDSYR